MFYEHNMWWYRFFIRISSPKGPSFVNLTELLFTGECTKFLRHLWRPALQDTQNQTGACRMYEAYCVHPEQLLVLWDHEVLPGFAISAWYQRYHMPRNHWIDCRSEVRHSVLYISHWKIPLKITAAEKEEYVKVRIILLLTPCSWTKDRQVERCLAIAFSTCSTCSW